MLAGLDAYGLRTLGLAGAADPFTYAAGSASVLAGLSGLAAWRRDVRLPRIAGVILAHLSVPLLLVGTGASSGAAGLALVALAAIDLGVTTWLPARRLVSATVAGAGAVTAAVALLVGGVGALLSDGPAVASLCLLALAGLAVAAAVRGGGPIGRQLLALPAPLVAAAALSLRALPHHEQPLVLAAVALAAV